MTTEFRRAHIRRTHIGDVFRDPISGRLLEVENVWGAPEYIAMKVDGKYYRYRYNEKTAVVALPRANRTWKREP